ncbi:MAG: hypothetical protein D6693_04735 [Planctomycetota bacterium]|nr:MAG: hypothetical protein D6693_04735 [Planctomycetota bacterium]
MSGPTRRTAALASLVVVVGALVALDRLGARDGAGDSAAPSARARVAQRAALVAQKRALIDAEARWLDALERVQREWGAVRDRLIVAPTAELATARLGQMIRSAADDFGLEVEATGTPTVRAPDGSAPLRVIGLRLSLRAGGPEALAAFVGRLERLPGSWIHIAGLNVLGPGRTPAAGLRVDLAVEALAWVGGEPAP